MAQLIVNTLDALFTNFYFESVKNSFDQTVFNERGNGI